MKKLSLFLMALMSAVAMQAEVKAVTIDCKTAFAGKGTSNTGSEVTYSQGGVTFSCDKAYGDGQYGVRCYKGSVITISAEETIAKIVFDFPIVGGKLYDGGLGVTEVTPNAKSWTSGTLGAQARLNGNLVVYVGEGDLPTIDTIGVSEARARINNGKLDACYVRGVVATTPSDPGSYKNTIFWMTDIANPNDSLQGYKISGLNGADIPTIDDIPFGLADTIIIFAKKLELYENKYEINGGYYFRTIGKSQLIDATTIFPYGYGAIVGEVVDNKYHFDVVLTRTEEYDIKNALHLGIVSSKEKGINGSYSLFAESSHIDGEPATPISGSVKFEWKKKGESWNVYQVKATFTAGELNYRLDGLYELPAVWLDEQGEEVDAANLDDDVPYQPNEGDTITCEQALSYAKGLGEEVSPIKVYIRGWVVSNPKTSDYNMSQRNFYINDDPKASSGIAQSYFCYEQGLDSIAKGNEVLLYGNIKLFKGVAEIEDGQIYRLTGTEQHYRDIQCVEAKPGAISVAQAMEIGGALEAAPGQTVETSSEYTVIGYIAKVSYQTKNDTATWFMDDEKESTFGDLQAYKCYIPALIDHGDKVMVTGKIAKYVKDDGSKTTIEFRYSKGEFVCPTPSDNEEIEAVEEADGKFILNGRFLIRYKNDWYNAQGDHYRR